MKKSTNTDIIFAIILTLMMTFMEMTALPASLFCNIHFKDVEPIYFALMLNCVLAFVLCGLCRKIFFYGIGILDCAKME